jgi:hypothetical protein
MKVRTLASASALALIASAAVAVPSAMAAPTRLPNGFTAAVIAHSGQKISGQIDATGYDLGIYIGPRVHGVTVSGATVTGANDEGILVQDTYGVVIKNNTIVGNAVSNDFNLSERKAIVLAGTTGVLVTGNTVKGNGDGGIGVYDDGPNSPSAPIAIDPNRPVPAIGNVVVRNRIADNFNGCGIVVSAKDAGSLVEATLVSHNLNTASVPGAVGGIIVAAGAVGAGTVADTLISDNIVTGGYIAGVGMHTSPGGAVIRTHIIGNTFAHNGGEEAAPGSPGTAVELLSGGRMDKTQVLHNWVADDYYGVFHVGDTATHIKHLRTSNVTVPVGP